MRLTHPGPTRARSRFWSPDAMKDELSHALFEALYELEVLPADGDGVVIGLYAVMDDLRAAFSRIESMDPGRTA